MLAQSLALFLPYPAVKENAHLLIITGYLSNLWAKAAIAGVIIFPYYIIIPSSQ